jgi:hypothetical protein
MKLRAATSLAVLLVCGACSSDPAGGNSGAAGAPGGGVAGGAAAGTGGLPATGGSAAAGTTAVGGGGGSAQASGGAGAGGANAGAGGSNAGAGGSTAGAGGSAAGTGGVIGAGGFTNNVPADYKGTPFTALSIPGKINTCDYDRGGAGVAWCHDMGNCGAGTTTGDYPQASGVYRPPMPASAKLCGGAACDDNVGVCRMNPAKPDNTIAGQPMPPTDTYLCYSVPGEWTKYSVHVAEAGTYSISCVMGVQQPGSGFNLSFGPNISSGNIAVTATPTTNSGSGEGFHSWDDRKNLGTITFPTAGNYVMTFTQVSRINADSFTFTKM